MDELAEGFEEHRAHLTRVAYRMLGSSGEAEDAVQEAWIRLSRSDSGGVTNLGGWLTTVVARVCLDELRARQARNAEHVVEPVIEFEEGPEEEAMLADSVGLALLVVLDTLTPAERLAFVLHDMFAVPFDEIAGILDRTPDAARQLASRGRRRVRGAAPSSDADAARQRELVNAFLAASRAGDFEALVAVLHPDVVFRLRGRYVRPVTTEGADEVARTVLRRGRPFARFARPALVNGQPGFVVGRGRRPFSVVAFTVVDDRIASVDIIARPKLRG
ncbi:MAG TPA: sigma-70 family RNA polymerase sigma factor [Gaiellaceae bacterium]|nr:sigma-70 family RNA polymerase sigma factor [Gaiellaceae bacterium]